jgi:hypothetical protein
MIGPVDPAEPLDPAFYRPLDGLDGERFHAGRSTTGPWFSDAQHGGPPAALLVRAFERLAEGRGDAREGTQLSRVTVEVLGPIPAGEVTVRASVERPGRAIALLGAELEAAGRVVLRARAWRIATGDTAGVAGGAPDPLPGPERAQARAHGRPEGWLPGYLDALEWRWLAGGLGEPGPGTAWARPLIPLVAGEETTPWQRLALVADSANGIGGPLDVRHWLFVNTDLTLHLHRPPAGEWIGVDASTVVGPTGLGTATGRLFDTGGAVGRSAQNLIVRPR